ncbi:MAG: hypothetical protein Q6L60_01080, partial [Thermostichus sp. HHBFW_bins_43]
DFDLTDNPPLIHRKDALVLPDYPGYEKFAKLTRQEEDWGLLEDPRSIRYTQGWEDCLQQHGATLQGHRVIWRKDVDPYQKKLLQSQMRSRHKHRPNNLKRFRETPGPQSPHLGG